MPLRVLFSKIVMTIFMASFLGGCQFLSEFIKPLSHSIFRAVVRGAIKDTAVHCEKAIEVLSDKWELMCHITDEMEIKYRTIQLANDETKFEILIDKNKGSGRKIIAAPTLLVGRNRPAELVAENLPKTRLEFKVERIR